MTLSEAFQIFFKNHYNNNTDGDLVHIDNCIQVAFSKIKWYIGDLKTLGDIAVNVEDVKKPIFNDNKLSDEVHKFVNTIPQQWLLESSYDDKKIIILSWFRGLTNNRYNQPKNVKIEFNKSPLMSSDATYIFIPIYNKNWNLMVVNPNSSTVSIYIINNEDHNLENYRDVHGSRIDPNRFKDWKVDKYIFKNLMDGYSIYYIILISYSIVMGYNINYKRWDIRSLVGQIAVEYPKLPDIDDLSTSYLVVSNSLKENTTADMRYSIGNERIAPMETNFKIPPVSKPPPPLDKSPIVIQIPNKINLGDDDDDEIPKEKKEIIIINNKGEEDIKIVNSEIDLMDDISIVNSKFDFMDEAMDGYTDDNDNIQVIDINDDDDNDIFYDAAQLNKQTNDDDIADQIDDVQNDVDQLKNQIDENIADQITENKQIDDDAAKKVVVKLTRLIYDENVAEQITDNDDDMSSIATDKLSSLIAENTMESVSTGQQLEFSLNKKKYQIPSEFMDLKNRYDKVNEYLDKAMENDKYIITSFIKRPWEEIRMTAENIALVLMMTFTNRLIVQPQKPYKNYMVMNLLKSKDSKGYQLQVKKEKILCLLAYFDLVMANKDGFLDRNVSFYLKDDQNVLNLGTKILNPQQINSGEPKIEDIKDVMHADFANSKFGGGVFGNGAVQEEIYLITHPEALFGKAVFDEFTDKLCGEVVGAIQITNYTGYGHSNKYHFQFDNRIEYTKPKLDSKNRASGIAMVAFDAINFKNKTSEQYLRQNIIRNFVKASAAFSFGLVNTAVASGRWGGGAFRGDNVLNALIQIAASSNQNRRIILTMMGDEITDSLKEIQEIVIRRQITVSQLMNVLFKAGEQMPTNDNKIEKVVLKILNENNKLDDTPFMSYGANTSWTVYDNDINISDNTNIYKGSNVTLGYTIKLDKRVVINDNESNLNDMDSVIAHIKSIQPPINIVYGSSQNGYIKNSQEDTIKLIRAVYLLDNENTTFTVVKEDTKASFMDLNDYKNFKDNPKTYISSVIIDFYVNSLLEDPPEKRICFYLRNAKDLLLLPPKACMFNGTDVIVGMVRDNFHYWLYYIHKPTQDIFIYDSLVYDANEENRHTDILAQLLIYFPNYKIHDTAKIPKQIDGHSCGLFLMKYAGDLIFTDRVHRNAWVSTSSFSLRVFRKEVIKYIKEKNNY